MGNMPESKGGKDSRVNFLLEAADLQLKRSKEAQGKGSNEVAVNTYLEAFKR